VKCRVTGMNSPEIYFVSKPLQTLNLYCRRRTGLNARPVSDTQIRIDMNASVLIAGKGRTGKFFQDLRKNHFNLRRFKLIFQISRQQTMLNLINRSVCLISNFFETYPDQYRTADMISHNTGFPTLTSSDSCKLPGFAVKLLNLPTNAAHLSYSRRIILSNVVCNNIVRAPGRQHNPEQFHFMIFRKILYLQDLQMSPFRSY